MDEIKTKQQVVQRIKDAEKILVTVSDDPSVDELSAALGLALLLEKQDKYATAIFSGQTPPAIAFLQPEKTFDDTTDSLRDFIIALNKEKADHLRYKVVDDAVKIFITPYKTTITPDDLEYSQGDYNVELVIALGVDNQDHLDGAIESHGQILHDADIITMTASDKTSNLGGIDWHDAQASSLSEMVVGLAEALKTDKTKSLLDETIATALLTGIVAKTDRFSNEHTTSKAMTVSATLMAAGADQQLIAIKLQESRDLPAVVEAVEEAGEADSEDDEQEGDNSGDNTQDGSATQGSASQDTTSLKIDKTQSAGQSSSRSASKFAATAAQKPAPKPAPKKDKNELLITHSQETLADLDKRVMGDTKAQDKINSEINSETNTLQDTAEAFATSKSAPAQPAPVISQSTGAYAINDEDQPILGGTLNATTEQAADDARREAEDDQNKTILTHAYLGQSPQVGAPAGGPKNDPAGFPGTPLAAPGSTDASLDTIGASQSDDGIADQLHSAYALDTPQQDTPQQGAPLGETNLVGESNLDAGSLLSQAIASAPAGIAFGGEHTIQPLPHDDPALTSGQAFGSVPTANPDPTIAPTPAPAYGVSTPIDLGLPLPPPLPDFSALPGALPSALPGAFPGAVPPPVFPLPASTGPVGGTGLLGDILAPEPTEPAPAAAVPVAPAYGTPSQAYAAPVAPAPADPAQFKIPGQQ